MRFVAGPDALDLHTRVKLHNKDFATMADFSVSAGEVVPFHLAWHPSHLPNPDRKDPVQAVADTEAWWAEWSAGCRYQGRWAEEVKRSLVVLKGLTYAPTGGIVAAATTSLPEGLGGERNWDYRFCWLRDATFTLMALMSAGYTQEAAAWRDWLLRAVAGRPDQAQIMYGAAGEHRLTEVELDWLPGYEGSRPVRVGNAAHDQFQLDVFGEVLDALHQGSTHGIPLKGHAWDLARELVVAVEDLWHQPDDGIWEVRSERRHFTHSKVMAWVALDRGHPLRRSRSANGAPSTAGAGYGTEIKAEVLDEGGRRPGRVRAVLRVHRARRQPAPDPPWSGSSRPTTHVWSNTVEAIQRELTEDGFVRRYLVEDTERRPVRERGRVPHVLVLAGR